MALFEIPIVAALNRLLGAEAWARERLVPFAGDTVELRMPPLPRLRFAILADGLLRSDEGGEEPSLALIAGVESLAALGGGEGELLRTVQIRGKADLANEVRFLLRHLRWDLEEELSRFMGDVAAHRLAGAARAFGATGADTLRRLAAALTEHARGPDGLLPVRDDVTLFAQQIESLQQRIGAAEARLARLR